MTYGKIGIKVLSHLLQESVIMPALSATALNVKVASALINHLSRFDGQGYDQMGNFAQDFLSSLAETGVVSDSLLQEYYSWVSEMTYNSEWLTEESFTLASKLEDVVHNYKCSRSRENAQAILDL